MNEIGKFLDYLRCELNYSPLTVRAYSTDLHEWAIYATQDHEEDLRVTDVTTSDLRTWIAARSREGDSPRTLRRKVSSLRTFFKYLMRTGQRTSNPASAIPLMRLPQDLPVFIRPADTERVLADTAGPLGDLRGEMPQQSGGEAETPHQQESFTRVRNRLIIELLYSTGMRCSELIGLLDVNVDTRHGELKLLGKRNKERIVPFGPALSEAIESYRLLRDSDPATAIARNDRTAPLLVRKDGLPLYRKLVYDVVHDTLAASGVHAARLSPHVLRHSFATDMLNAGASLSSVKELLGHASLASTQVYTHVTYSELQQNYKLAHPRALKKGGNYGN